MDLSVVYFFGFFPAFCPGQFGSRSSANFARFFTDKSDWIEEPKLTNQIFYQFFSTDATTYPRSLP